MVFHISLVNWRGVKFNVRMIQRFGVVVFHRSMVNWGVNLKVTLPVNSDSKLEGALLLGTRCHCMNTMSQNMKSFHVCPLDVTCQGGVNLKVTLVVNLKVTLAVNSASKLEGTLLFGTRCHCMNA